MDQNEGCFEFSRGRGSSKGLFWRKIMRALKIGLRTHFTNVWAIVISTSEEMLCAKGNSLHVGQVRC